MRIAIDEACLSLREGNHGFGAVIVRNDKVIAQAHDTEETENDPTAHAEMEAIRKASARVGKNLKECKLYCTHEPCPMCATAIVWSHLPFVAYGYGIEPSMEQGRNRIALPCTELFERSGAAIRVETGLLHEECSVLYDRRIRAEVKKLRGGSDKALRTYDEETAARRLSWFRAENRAAGIEKHDLLELAYRILLRKLGISENQAPIVRQSATELVFHSSNPCPTLEACRILGLDTRSICKVYNEASTEKLIRQIDPRLRFTRNYEKLRPHAEYCEEIISYEVR